MNVSEHLSTRLDLPLPGEAPLVHRAKSGDSEAFAQLYDAYIARVYRYVYFRVADDDAAEDLTSQVFLKAWSNLDRFSFSRTPYLAWLYTIAHNAVIDHYRTRKVTAALDDVQLSQQDHAEVVENEIDLTNEMKTIKEALQLLTDDQQKVLTLKFIEGMSNNEIARHLGKREGAIRALQMRGLQALAKQLEEKMVI